MAPTNESVSDPSGESEVQDSYNTQPINPSPIMPDYDPPQTSA